MATSTPTADAAVRARNGSRDGQGRRERAIRRVLSELLTNPATTASLFLIVVMIGLSGWVLVFDPLDPNGQDLVNRLSGPTAAHWLGTDHLGRDVFARLVHATPVALLAIAQGAGIAALLGTLPGIVAGFRGRWFDAIANRVSDGLIVFPGLILALAIVGILGPSLTNAMIAVGVVYSPRMFRVARAATLTIKNDAFVESAQIMGAKPHQIVIRHLLPNVAGPVLVQLALVAARVLLAESSLSYLGLGVQAPAATWGSMIRGVQSHIASQPWLIVFPGVAILLTAMAFNFLADGVATGLRSTEVGEGDST